jgi:hypothetical protein
VKRKETVPCWSCSKACWCSSVCSSRWRRTRPPASPSGLPENEEGGKKTDGFSGRSRPPTIVALWVIEQNECVRLAALGTAEECARPTGLTGPPFAGSASGVFYATPFFARTSPPPAPEKDVGEGRGFVGPPRGSRFSCPPPPAKNREDVPGRTGRRPRDVSTGPRWSRGLSCRTDPHFGSVVIGATGTVSAAFTPPGLRGRPAVS